MALAYIPPNVAVREFVSPNVDPLLASPANVCVVGRAQGFIRRTDRVVLTDDGGGPVAVPLPNLPEGAVVQAVVDVKGTLDSVTYTVTTDYTVDLGNGTITRVAAGNIDADTKVNVTYDYVPENYYSATRLFDIGSVYEIYGTAYAADGHSINSRLSYAALLAFENGASSVVCQPLFRLDLTDPDAPVRQGVNDTQAADVVNWTATFEALRDIEDVNVVVPVIGQSDPEAGDTTVNNVHTALVNHINFMKDNDQFVIGVFGEDGTSAATEATRDTLIEHASTLKGIAGGAVASHCVFLSPAKFLRSTPYGKTISVGGQYAAAAVAGMIAARPVSSSLTRKQVGGLVGVQETRTKQEKNDEAQAGLFVIEQRGFTVQVRHAITLDDTTTATRELSVVRAKHRMIESIRNTLERQVIGQVVADGNSPFVVQTAVIGVLEALREDRDIVEYANVDARQLTYDPTHIEVRFSYRPAFPLNYVTVTFSLDLTSGTLAEVSPQGSVG